MAARKRQEARSLMVENAQQGRKEEMLPFFLEKRREPKRLLEGAGVKEGPHPTGDGAKVRQGKGCRPPEQPIESFERLVHRRRRPKFPSGQGHRVQARVRREDPPAEARRFQGDGPAAAERIDDQISGPTVCRYEVAGDHTFHLPYVRGKLME